MHVFLRACACVSVNTSVHAYMLGYRLCELMHVYMCVCVCVFKPCVRAYPCICV